MKNCLSFDIEGFIESNIQSFQIHKKYISASDERYEIEKNVGFMLEFLDTFDIKATFFFLGRISEDIPQVIKETTLAGHEIACHSHEHKRIFNMTEQEFREDLIRAKTSLEDVSGEHVYGFRAPDFSITDSNPWALDALKETGFIYDSSIYPISMHDVYGVKDSDPCIHKLDNGLLEFPLSTSKIFSKRLPFGGGGYFRLFPLILTRFLMRKSNKLGYPCMFYLHPYELGPVIPRVKELTYYRKFRHYHNCSNGSNRLKTILKAFQFCPAIEILQERGFVNNRKLIKSSRLNS